jgi:hypothetical protein
MGLKEKHNLRVYGKWRIFGCRGENVRGAWRNLRGEDIHS